MNDPFSQNNVNGKIPLIQKTIERLSDLLGPRVNLLKTPLVMRSWGPRESPILDMESPYFKGPRVKFTSTFINAKKTKDNFCFLIVANSFKATFSSHAMVGWWCDGVLTLFDPNGDFYTPDPDSVYNGYGYFKAPQVRGLNNPLYNTLLHYFRNLEKVRVYTGASIPCPKGESRTCAYRALMYIVATGLSKDPVEVVRYTSKLVKTKFKELKDLTKTNSPNVKNLVDSLFAVNKNTSIDTTYLNLHQPPPQPPRTRPPLPPPDLQPPGKRRKATS